jgi:Tfp pilus assembly protein FimV
MAVRSEELFCRPGAPIAARRVPRSRACARRRVVGGALAAAIVAGTLLIGGPAPASRPGAPRAVVVRPGQTLWDVAERYAPTGVDARAYVDAVVTLNDLEGVLQAGDRLRLPR